MATSKRPLCVCSTSARKSEWERRESFDCWRRMGLSLNTGTIASWCRPIVDRWTDAELKYSFVPHHCRRLISGFTPPPQPPLTRFFSTPDCQRWYVYTHTLCVCVERERRINKPHEIYLSPTDGWRDECGTWLGRIFGGRSTTERWTPFAYSIRTRQSRDLF